MAKKTRENVDVSDFQTDNVRNSRRLVGQELAISDDHRTLSQSISLEKAGMHTPQTFSVTTHNENLLSVTQDGKMLASFKEKEDGSLQMIAAKEFVESINSSENLHLEGNVDENGNYVFDMSNLKLTKSGNLDTGEVRANNTAFAIMFSALGSQIRDAAGNRAVQTNTEKPFDLTVSTNFIKYAVQEKNGCTLEMEEPIFSALMISRIHLARETFKSGKTSPVHLDLQKEFGSREQIDPNKNVVLHSIPIFRNGQDDKNPEYLNIMQRGGKSYLYIQTRDAQNRLTAPQFHEINNVSLQTSGEISGLYFGLKEKSQTSDILAELDFEKNLSSLRQLSSILQKEFEETKILSKVEELKQESPIKDVPLYNISSNRHNEIVSFGNVRELERTVSNQKDGLSPADFFHDDRERTENPVNSSDDSDDDGQAAFANPDQPEQNPTEGNKRPFVEETLPQEESPAEDGERPHEQSHEQPQDQDERTEEEQPEQEKAEKKPEKKQWKDLDINPPNADTGKTLAALFMLSILVMILIPVPIFTFWIPLAIGLGAVLNLAHPINTTKGIINWAHHGKERKAEKQKYKQALKELHTEEKEQKMFKKVYKLNKKIDAKKALIASYEKYKDKIDANPKAFMKKHRGKNAEECINELKLEIGTIESKKSAAQNKYQQALDKAAEKGKNKAEKEKNKAKNKLERKENRKLKKEGLSTYALPEEKSKSASGRRAGTSRTDAPSAERNRSAGGRSK